MFKIFLHLSAFVLVIALAKCEEFANERYEGYTLYRVYPQNSQHIKKLRSIQTAQRENDIEFWTEPNENEGPVDIMASPEEQDALQNQLKIYRIPYKTIMYNVAEVIRRTQRVKTWPALSYRFGANDSLGRQEELDARNFFTAFQSYSKIEEKLRELEKDPRVTLEYPGLTYERRQMYLVKVSKDPAANKPVIFIDAGHHAREWISHSTLLYILESLVNENMPTYNRANLYSDDELNEIDSETRAKLLRDVGTKLDEYDFWFLPVVNPDGYDYTRTNDRLWRKTRSRNSLCNGVDPNRNYPIHWREVGASNFPCAENYAGPHPLSEPETNILSNILNHHQKRIVMYISLHSYSQLFLVPYGHARMYPENYEDLKKVANAGMSGVYSLRGTSYKFGTSAILLYPASGASDDYAYTIAKIKLAYTIELPDTGEYGFLAPPREIIPIGQETTIGIAAMIEAMKNLEHRSSKIRRRIVS